MSTTRRGPELPYTIVAGVTPFGPSWVVASAKIHGSTFAPEPPKVYISFLEILGERPSFSVVVLNAPIGYPDLPESVARVCDREARVLLDWRAGAIHNAPSRAVLAGQLDVSESGLDAVTATLLPRYREIAAEMLPYHQRVVYEGNPELSFYQINGEAPLDNSKKIEEGRDERRTLLMGKMAGIEKVLDADIGVPVKHLYDAAALLWTARRVHGKAAKRIPKEPEWDSEGIRMEIVF